MLNPQRKFYRWGPIEGCPLFMYFNIEPAFAPLKKLLGTTYSESLIIFMDSKVTWLLDEEELITESRKFVGKNILDQKYFKKYLDIWYHRSNVLLNLFSELDKIVLPHLSHDELHKKFSEFVKAYSDWFTITISHELATSSLEPLFKSQLQKYFDTLESFQEAFSVLAAPETLSFYRKEEGDLIRILMHGNDQNKPLEKHQQKYYWIFNSYAKGQVLDIKYFENQLDELRSTNYKKTLADIENYQNEIKIKKNQIVTRANLSKQDVKLATTISLFAELLDERKMINFRAEHYLELFLQEYAKRTKYAIDDLRLLLPQELLDSQSKIDTSLIERRRQCFVLSCNENYIEDYDGDHAVSIAQQFSKMPKVQNQIIKGNVASRGTSRYFRGTARVILNISQIGRVQEGDILITTMTSPDFVIGMKKAGAIITDTGGMLSHAAIVSREFGIPCIVGTEVATQMIKDGDIVELHCINGTIRIA